jgi:hypothetical protein
MYTSHSYNDPVITIEPTLSENPAIRFQGANKGFKRQKSNSLSILDTSDSSEGERTDNPKRRKVRQLETLKREAQAIEVTVTNQNDDRRVYRRGGYNPVENLEPWGSGIRYDTSKGRKDPNWSSPTFRYCFYADRSGNSSLRLEDPDLTDTEFLQTLERRHECMKHKKAMLAARKFHLLQGQLIVKQESGMNEKPKGTPVSSPYLTKAQAQDAPLQPGKRWTLSQILEKLYND